MSLISIAIILFGSFMFSILYIISLQPETLSLRYGSRAYKLCGTLRFISIAFEMLIVVGYVLFIFGDVFNYRFSDGRSILIRFGGIIVTLGTIIIMGIGLLHAGKEAATPLIESKLYHGIYDYMRHPQTLGEMLCWFGIAMILNSLTLFVFSVIWIPIFIGFTIIEDNDLSVRFGDEFIDYTKHVGIFWRKYPANWKKRYL